ncbi:CzcA family heavy metal efflux pump [Bradyrhizobium japonicum]|uniref:efflux RND transporter permease subunit n=1 Tax=Bradyrhizobium japonicum TaxID=375 RepID=UPI002169F702|nr:efflux RND transporter permease subunit [Bradyrhizobium japonicum]MCS3495626.1 CzcA family heavy metal efflux pump [Bradyrhizobium japonicum]MCS3962212.1 CzcA family heavy metal efflux pump [Bradyrhizobium japonicum]MCS3994529.1 CzcA family heavy metal efflux pump [Bradyrhizobium japonicum]
MWLIKIALSRPYTFIVMAIAIVIMGPLAIMSTPVDIFPSIGIPVVSMIWTYAGLPAREIANRISANFERVAPVVVNGVEHIDSSNLNGVGVSKIYFQPGANVPLATSQLVAGVTFYSKFFPPGTTPPQILTYNAASVPVLQLALSSKTMTEQALYDTGNIYVRSQLSGVPGLSLPYPYGGKQRQVQVDLYPQQLQAFGLSAQDVHNAIINQNLIIPAGTQKIGAYEYVIGLNGAAVTIDDLNNLPIKQVNGSTIYVRDVAHVRDGSPPQTNLVRLNGEHAVLMTVQKTGSSSTLQIVHDVKAKLSTIQAAGPEGLKIDAVGDQSVFVSAAVSGVIREGLIAAALTATMILLFLGSWRSTLIIAVSIPLSVLVSIIVLSLFGQSINLMTLGGLALAVGILVDDATVAIENINAHLERGEPVRDSVLNGSAEIAAPAFVATLCICIVFMPMFFLSGVASYLFVPMAEAIVFAMLASYILSRTLVPTLANLMLKSHVSGVETGRSNALARLQAGFERRFEAMRENYRRVLSEVVARRCLFIPIFFGGALASVLLIFTLGSDFFPSVDGGQIKLHVRAHAGTRVEETARIVDQVEDELRHTIPSTELSGVVDNIGLPVSGVNLSYSNSAPTGPADADILVSLAAKHNPTADYVRRLRIRLPQTFPGVTFAFLPADIVSQILNFGSPAPIDVQIVGRDMASNALVAQRLLQRIRKIPGIADARIQQDLDAPTFTVAVDRSRASDVGLTQKDVANTMLIALAGSFQTAPTFWLDPKSGVSYPIVSQAPQTDLQTLDSLRNTLITGSPGSHGQILGGISTIKRNVLPSVDTRYNAQPAMDIYATNADRDFGSVANDVREAIGEITKAGLPKGVTITLRGQVVIMATSYAGLLYGLGFAMLLVYLLMVVNFQSMLDPFIIVTALPATMAGIVWMLFLTGTNLSVPALTGAIMSVGVATANSILVVSLARDRLSQGDDPAVAAIAAGFGRFRPVLMTALAMIIGMLPMALGLGEGGEQNAPLGRAVIGGLIVATIATLTFVPAVFALLHGPRRPLNPPTAFDGTATSLHTPSE